MRRGIRGTLLVMAAKSGVVRRVVKLHGSVTWREWKNVAIERSRSKTLSIRVN